MKYLVRVNDLGQKIDYLEKQLDIINEKVNYLETYKNSVIWEGDGADTFYENYESYINELKGIEQNTLSFIEYLTTYYDKYGNTYSTLRSKYKNMLDEEL